MEFRNPEFRDETYDQVPAHDITDHYLGTEYPYAYCVSAPGGEEQRPDVNDDTLPEGDDVTGQPAYPGLDMEIESGPSGHEVAVERMELPYEDEELGAAVLDREGSRLLLEASPVTWIRAAIGIETGRGASYVTDRELARRHSEGGFAEWDPKVAKAVALYLRNKGFIGLYGLRGE